MKVMIMNENDNDNVNEVIMMKIMKINDNEEIIIM